MKKKAWTPSICKYMRKRRIREVERSIDSWFSMLSAEEQKSLNDELIWRVDHWMYFKDLLPDAMPEDLKVSLRNLYK